MNEQLKNVISELEQYHVNPHEIDFEDKIVYAYLYNSVGYRHAIINTSGRNIDQYANVFEGAYYLNAIQNLGTIIWKSISGYVDYVILSRYPEGNEDKLIESYTDDLRLVKKYSDKRVSKKKDPLPPVGVIWEDEMYEYLLERGIFDYDVMRCKILSVQSDIVSGRDRIIPFIEKGKNAVFSIKLKKRTDDEVQKAIDDLSSIVPWIKKIGSVASGPVLEGDEVVLRIQSKRAPKADSSKKEDYLTVFQNDDDTVKLSKAISLFKRCVEAVEKEMDKSGDYNDPTVSTDSELKGKLVTANVSPESATDFFDEAVKWMKENDMKYDFQTDPDNIRKWYESSYSTLLDQEQYYFDGENGIRYPVGIAVAFMIYAAPDASVEIEFARDKWEWRGDYSGPHRVCLEISNYGTDFKVSNIECEAFDM